MTNRPSPSNAFLYLDPSAAGISGNMLLGALLDAMAPVRRSALLSAFRRAFARKGFSIKSCEVKRHGFRGFFVDASEVDIDTHDLAHEVNRAGRALKVSPEGRALALAAVNLIIDFEAEVHGQERSRVHLHEISGLDTVFDAVAVARALDEFDFFTSGARVFSRPVEAGSGTVTFSHGTTTVPPPVSQLILARHKIPFTQHADREVATPTGLALLACLRPSFDPPPASRVVAMGVGAGSMELPDRPNLLFLQLREPLGRGRARAVHDPVAQIEVSLDDVSGESASHALSRAIEEGALDAHLVQTIAKKGRPGQLLLVLAREEDADRLADLLAEETGSWGVRIAYRVARFKAVPRVEVVAFAIGRRRFRARVKFLIEGGRIARVKAEYDDVAAAAREAGVTLAAAREAAEEAARRVLAGKGGKKG